MGQMLSIHYLSVSNICGRKKIKRHSNEGIELANVVDEGYEQINLNSTQEDAEERNSVSPSAENISNVQEAKHKTYFHGQTYLITNELNDYFQNIQSEKKMIFYSVKVTLGNICGSNFLGTIVRIRINAIHEGRYRKFKWIVKTSPHLQTCREMFDFELLQDRELYVYQKVFPQFEILQKKPCLRSKFTNCPKLVPTKFHLAKECLVMVDMKPFGYEMKSRHEVLNYCHVKLAMRTYGKLHALSYALKEKQPNVFEEICHNMNDVLIKSIRNDKICRVQQLIIDAAIDSSGHKKQCPAYRKLYQFSRNLKTFVEKFINETNAFSVIGHGSCWTTNVLWKYDGDLRDSPVDMCLTDWQTSRYGSPAYDITYFLFSCTDKAFRDEHYDEMIKYYYYSVCSHLVELRVDPENHISFAALENELKRHSIIGLYGTILTLAISTTKDNNVPKWLSGELSLPKFEANWRRKTDDFELFSKRIRDVIQDFDEKGYLDCLVERD